MINFDGDETLKQLVATMGEQLHADLLPYLRDEGVFRMVHHPLVVSVVGSGPAIAAINRTYMAKRAKLEAACAEGDGEDFVFVHERPYRLQALREAADMISMAPAQYWSLVGRVWTDSENIFESIEVWRTIWADTMADRHLVMEPEEQDHLAGLPDEFPVWRGYAGAKGKKGLSWTTDKDRAIWFAKRFSGFTGRQPNLAEARLRKQHALAYFARRSEDEIVVLPERLIGLTVSRL